jgi:hypothetical protein
MVINVPSKLYRYIIYTKLQRSADSIFCVAIFFFFRASHKNIFEKFIYPKNDLNSLQTIPLEKCINTLKEISVTNLQFSFMNKCFYVKHEKRKKLLQGYKSISVSTLCWSYYVNRLCYSVIAVLLWLKTNV